MSQVDVAVIGGGIAGAATALNLAREGACVGLIDPDPPGPEHRHPRPGERLAPEIRFALDDLHIDWRGFAHEAQGSQYIWETPDVTSQPPPLARFAPLIVERTALDAAVLDAARVAGARMVFGAKVLKVTGSVGNWTVGLDRHPPVSAACIVDATGRRAAVARSLGARQIRSDPLIAILRWWSGPEACFDPFRVEALSDGWLYSTPLPGGGGVCAYMTMRASAGGPVELWCEAIRQSRLVGPNLPDKTEAVWSAAQLVSAAPGRLERIAGPGWVAVGDAALHSDPIEGRGVFRAILGARAVANLITAPTDQQAQIRNDYETLLTSEYTNHLALRRTAYAMSDIVWPRFVKFLGPLEPG
jgi:flavin-dependent dehydrogenase